MKSTILVVCPQCHREVEIEGPYDENTDQLVACSECSWSGSKWTFDYSSEEVHGN